MLVQAQVILFLNIFKMVDQYILVVGILLTYTLVSIKLRGIKTDSIFTFIMCLLYIIMMFKKGIIE